MKKIIIPKFVEAAISILEKNEFEAYVVGGAVRDSLLGWEPDDWDITTNAKPDEIKKIFEKHLDTGVKHGTITAFISGFPIEITTYRTDGEYKDFRRPAKVTFTTKLKNDLMRRDFTVNALAYNPIKGLVDICGGLRDLSDGIIRCVGNAEKRFKEDALRILRALRFSAVLGFEIEPETYEAICDCANLLVKISAERITAELTRLLMAKKGIERLFETGVGDVILPEVSQCFSIWQNNCEHIYDVGNHTLEVIYNTPQTPVLRYGALLHDIGKIKTKVVDKWGFDRFPNHAAVSAAMANEILKRLKVNTKHKKAIINLIRMHSAIIKPDKLSVRKTVTRVGKEGFADIIAFKKANALAKSPAYGAGQLAQLKKIESIYHDDIKNKIPLSIKELAVNGDDLREIGFAGSEIGKMLKALLMRVIEKPSLNERKRLLEIAKCQKMPKKCEQ